MKQPNLDCDPHILVRLDATSVFGGDDLVILCEMLELQDRICTVKEGHLMPSMGSASMYRHTAPWTPMYNSINIRQGELPNQTALS